MKCRAIDAGFQVRNSLLMFDSGFLCVYIWHINNANRRAQHAYLPNNPDRRRD